MHLPTIQWIVYIVWILVCLVLTIVNSSTRHEHSRLAREFTTRLQELSKWTCNVPKPRLVYVLDEHRSRISPNAEWLPKAAVIHRCDQSSGCCSNHPAFTCKATATETISLIFQKVNMLTAGRSYEYLEFVNHTSCACEQIEGVGNDVT